MMNNVADIAQSSNLATRARWAAARLAAALARLGRDTRGATLVEYAVLLGLLSGGAITMIVATGDNLSRPWTTLADSLPDASDGPGTPGATAAGGGPAAPGGESGGGPGGDGGPDTGAGEADVADGGGQGGGTSPGGGGQGGDSGEFDVAAAAGGGGSAAGGGGGAASGAGGTGSTAGITGGGAAASSGSAESGGSTGAPASGHGGSGTANGGESAGGASAANGGGGVAGGGGAGGSGGGGGDGGGGSQGDGSDMAEADAAESGAEDGESGTMRASLAWQAKSWGNALLAERTPGESGSALLAAAGRGAGSSVAVLADVAHGKHPWLGLLFILTLIAAFHAIGKRVRRARFKKRMLSIADHRWDGSAENSAD